MRCGDRVAHVGRCASVTRLLRHGVPRNDGCWSRHGFGHSIGAGAMRTGVPRSTPSAARIALNTPTSEPQGRARASPVSPGLRRRTIQRNGMPSIEMRSTEMTAPSGARIAATTGGGPASNAASTCHSARLSARKARSRASSTFENLPFMLDCKPFALMLRLCSPFVLSLSKDERRGRSAQRLVEG